MADLERFKEGILDLPKEELLQGSSNHKKFKTGSLYQGNNIRMINKISDCMIDLTLTSPPYDNLRNYTEESSWGWDKFTEIARELYRVTKQGGVVVWNVSDGVVGGSETGTSFRQALYFKDQCGFNLHDTMIWQKPNFSNPSSNRYHQVFEYVFILSKGKPKTFNPIKDRENIYAGKVGSFGENTVTQADGSKTTRKRKVNTSHGMRHNVWLMKTAGQTQESRTYKHPAMFPLEFAKDHILSWSNEGDIVLDPFMGSGTTACAAIDTKRKWVGAEISQEYFSRSVSRVSSYEESL